MKINSAVFSLSAPDLASCPPGQRPEFAFIGRSNVGKSSLVNALTGRKTLAKVSDLPGKTRLLNFFLINAAWHLVDLPGYGYAKVGQSERAAFNDAVQAYLARRETLRCVFVLIDANLPPQAIDLKFLRWLAETGAPFVLVFTKVDKQSAARTQANVALFKNAIADWWGGELPGSILCSSKTKVGRSEILAVIADAIATKPSSARLPQV
jgi:GTP-binding protein